MSFRAAQQIPDGLVPLEPGDPRELGGHRLLGRLGAGGMGAVYLGQLRSGRLLAVKVVRPEFARDPEFVARFRREVTAGLTVRGRYTATLIDADLDDASPWFATEYVPGPTLEQAVAQRGPLDPPEVCALVDALAEALSTVHQAGLVHRDLKPANILLGPDGPCLIDLGIAHAEDATALTSTGMPLGTPVFMAPEQARGQTATTATDVWALGAVAFFAATGRRPFGQGRPDVVYYRVVHEEPQLDACPPSLLAFVRACLSKDPAARPTVQAVLADGPMAGSAARPLPPLPQARQDGEEEAATHLRDTVSGARPAADDTSTHGSTGSAHARAARRRRMLGAAAAVVLVAAGTTAAAMWHRGAPQPPAPPVSPTPTASPSPAAVSSSDLTSDPTSDLATGPSPATDPTTDPTTAAAGAVVDECLLGSWEQTTMTDTWSLLGTSVPVTGWNGRVLEFHPDGTEVVSYTGADAVRGTTTAGELVDTWSGQSVYALTASEGTIRYSGVDHSHVSVVREFFGVTETYRPSDVAGEDITYVCDDSTMTQSSGDYAASFTRIG